MTTTPSGPNPTESYTPQDDFQELLAECLARIERQGSGALDEFRAENPEFASRLGRQLDWLVDRLAEHETGLPEKIGPYRVRHRLGRGGMGEVFLAEQTTPFHRAVAVKIIRLSRQTDSRVARFAREVQALAVLNHDGIAKVFEAGEDAGRPYFSMEYVPGQPITDYCREERLTLQARLRLFVKVCRAVEHAHRQGIIHRDIKPSNILVHGPSNDPVAKIIDFGLAKVVEREGKPQTMSMVGTPDYMSPEQVDRTGRVVVDTRADVYALGVVLYELLTGVVPLSVGRVDAADIGEMVRVIRERQPSSPSLRIREVASGSDPSTSFGRISPRQLVRLVAGDLDGIVLKALAKDVDRRYSSAAHLADDVLRYLRHEPVTACPHTAWYVLRKFVQRHAVGVGFTMAIAVLLLGGLTAVYLQERAISKHLERGDLLGLGQFVSELRAREGADPPAARPEDLERLRTWLAELRGVYEQIDRMRAQLATPAIADADPTDRVQWASGQIAQQALRSVLTRAVQDLERMFLPDGEVARVERRIEWAERVRELTVTDCADEWARVRREVLADPAFAGLELDPQVGLIPVGRRASGLQEFLLPLPSGERPRRVAGQWQIGPRSWPVFVLLPGGDIRLGCQKEDPEGPHYDPLKGEFEVEVEEAHLAPFFASRFEITFGQWQMISRDGADVDVHEVFRGPSQPVVNVHLEQMRHAARAWGMRLPTWREWEYMARGGTATPYWCGREASSLEGNENLFDRSLDDMPDAGGEGVAVPWDDGYFVTAPVGRFPPNGHLLHDVLGNVCEATYEVTADGPYSEIRASSWHEGARDARATARLYWDGAPRPSIGFRPVISVQR